MAPYFPSDCFFGDFAHWEGTASTTETKIHVQPCNTDINNEIIVQGNILILTDMVNIWKEFS